MFLTTYARLYPNITEHYVTIRCSVSGHYQVMSDSTVFPCLHCSFKPGQIRLVTLWHLAQSWQRCSEFIISSITPHQLKRSHTRTSTHAMHTHISPHTIIIQTLSDIYLMLMVLGVVGICLILLIIGEAVLAFRPAVSLLHDDETSSDTNYVTKILCLGEWT